MDWMPYVHDAIEYIEENLLTISNSGEVAKHINMSEIYLQKGFQVLTGYTISEYIRNRRLYQAAVDIMETDERIVDIGLKYGFDSPDSFSRAFTRFHGFNPSEMRKSNKDCRVFLPLKIELKIRGGDSLSVKYLKKYKFKVIGCKKAINKDNEKEELESFKNIVYNRYKEGKEKENDDFSSAMEENNIGEFGIRKNNNEKSFEYMIAGRYVGGNIPESMCVEEIPEADWGVVEYPDGNDSFTSSEIEEAKRQIKSRKNDKDTVVIEWYETVGRVKYGFRSALWFRRAEQEKDNSETKKYLSKRTVIIWILIGMFFSSGLIALHLTNKLGNNADLITESNAVTYDNNNEEDDSGSIESGNVLPSKRMPPTHYLELNGEKYYSVDIVEHYPVYYSDGTTDIVELDRYVDRIVDYTVTGVGNIIGKYYVTPVDNVPEYSEFLSEDLPEELTVYEILGVDIGFAVAVKRSDKTEEYQVYSNPEYITNDLNSFLEAIQFKTNHNFIYAWFIDENGEPDHRDVEQEVYYADGTKGIVKQTRSLPITDKNFEKLLTESNIPIVSIANDNTSRNDNGIVVSEEQLGKPILRITVSYLLLAQWDSYIDLYEGGYIITDIGLSKRCFYVGADAVENLIKYMKNIRASVILGEQRAKERKKICDVSEPQ